MGVSPIDVTIQHTMEVQREQILDVQRAKAGDVQAYERLAEQLMPSLYRMARSSLSCEADCADVMQETLLIIWQKLPSLRSNDYFKTWALRILINQCKKTGRKPKTIPLEQAEEQPAPNSTARDQLLDALGALPEKFRTPLVLKNLEGYSVDEIATMLRIPQGTVKSRLSRARNKMQELLQEDIE